jgi:ribosomal-protein-alanine N-acetyltransferase
VGCRDYAFEKLGKERVVVLVRPENVVSQSVARKLGAKVERETVFEELVHTVFVHYRSKMTAEVRSPSRTVLHLTLHSTLPTV